MKTPGFKGLNLPGKLVLLNERFLSETNIHFDLDTLLNTTTHELLHTHVDNLLGGRISQTIQGGNLPNSAIHRWIVDRANAITAWGKVADFDSRLKPDISAGHLESFRK